MINSYFGIEKMPFSLDSFSLLKHQQEIFDIIKVHSYQGGLCLLLGDPGTGKSVVKEAIKQSADKFSLVVTVSRTLHTYINTVKILCSAFAIDYEGSPFKCEKRLIEEAFTLFRNGKSIILIIDDAHLMEIETLRKLRLLFEDFPKNHNIILVGQPHLLNNIALKVNDDIKSRVTFSTIIQKLNPDDMHDFILSQFDLVSLPHNTLDDDAFSLIVRSSDGILRRARNLSLSCLLETVRAGKKIISLDIVNRVLLQPHWRLDKDVDLLF